MVDVYRTFAEEWMAMPVLVGPKSEGQKFPGAVYTLCIEAMMQDGKALQAGTSHFLGQNFAKAFDVKFQNEQSKEEFAWATSWGVSHAADRRPHHDALRRQRAGGAAAAGAAPRRHRARWARTTRSAGRASPPRRSWRGRTARPAARRVLRLRADRGEGRRRRSTSQPGFTFAEYELRGVPVRVELGPKDIEKSACVLARRDVPGKEGKQFGVPLAGRRGAHRRRCSATFRRRSSTGRRRSATRAP